MGMPIREKQVCSIQVLISRPRLDHGGPERVTIAPSGPYRPLFRRVSTAPSGPYRWSLSRTMITTPSSPYRPLFHTVSIAPSGLIVSFIHF